MPLAVNYPVGTQMLGPFPTTSVGTTPVAAYGTLPFRARIVGVKAVLKGAISAANASCAVTIGGVTMGSSPLVIPFSGSAAGVVTSFTVANPRVFDESASVVVTPSGATGSTIGCDFYFIVTQASA